MTIQDAQVNLQHMTPEKYTAVIEEDNVNGEKLSFIKIPFYDTEENIKPILEAVNLAISTVATGVIESVRVAHPRKTKVYTIYLTQYGILSLCNKCFPA